MSGLKSVIFRGFTLLVLLTGVAVSCNKRPSDVLSEEEMIDLLADMQLAEAYRDMAGPELSDSMRRTLSESVLAAHGVSYSQLDKTLQYYGRNSDEYFALLDKVNAKLAGQRKSIDGKAEIENLMANNIWPYPSMTFFNPNGATEGLIFELPAEVLEKGDILEWRLRTNNAVMANGMLGVDYTDGTTTYIKRNSSGNRNILISLQTDTGKTVKRIYGRFTMPRVDMPVWADSISLIHAPYDSTKYNNIYQQQRYYGPVKRKTLSEPSNPDSIQDRGNGGIPVRTIRPGQ